MVQKLVFNYFIFAIIATFANIVGQDLMVRLYDGWAAIELSIFTGTIMGLFVKYELDRRYIFYFFPKNKKEQRKTFLLYAVMGVFTTLIFWGMEGAFHLLFQTKSMRYVGGVLGLAMGYVSKYHLDKHFVFKKI